MSAISGRTPPVAVEYTARLLCPLRNERVLKVFDDAYAARRFYAAQLKAGTEPRVRKVEGGAR